MREFIKWGAAVIVTILFFIILIFIGWAVSKIFFYIFIIGIAALLLWALWLFISGVKDIIDDLF